MIPVTQPQQQRRCVVLVVVVVYIANGDSRHVVTIESHATHAPTLNPIVLHHTYPYACPFPLIKLSRQTAAWSIAADCKVEYQPLHRSHSQLTYCITPKKIRCPLQLVRGRCWGVRLEVSVS